MKLLAIGDFHGRFPKKILKIIKKEKIDALLSNGDYLPFYYRKLWFKYCYGKDTELWEVIGKNKLKERIIRDLKAGERVFKQLNKLKIPVITVLGNVDKGKWSEAVDMKRRKWSWEDQDFFAPLFKKYRHIKDIQYSYTKLRDFIIIGGGPSSFPGKVKSKMYKKLLNLLKTNFKKFRKENKEGKVIFLSHNVPYNTKLDKVGIQAHKAVRGKHVGSKLVRKVIDKFHPVIHIGGHIHESRGTQKLGKTLAINPGAIHEGHYAIINIEDGKAKVKLI